MKPDLLGYVLNALDPPALADAETYLRDHPEVMAEVESLRQAVEPLSWDPVASPPPGLADRTMQYLSVAAVPERIRVPMGVSWRRIIQVAAVLLVVVTAVGAGVSWLGRLRLQQFGTEPSVTQLVACQDNLQKIFVSLCAYGDTHNRQFPNAAMALAPPRNAGGLVFSMLHDNNSLPADIKLVCPGAPSAACGFTNERPLGVNDVKAMTDAAYQQWNQTMQSGYAYALGYQQNGQLIGPRLEDGKPSALMPLMADSAPADPVAGGHSLNHGGSGQNVLYCDGHVVFCVSRNVGYNLDDIYLNRASKVAAGVDWRDAVLTSTSVPE